MANQDPCQQQRDAIENIQELLDEEQDFMRRRQLAGQLTNAKAELSRCIAAHAPHPSPRPDQIWFITADLRIEVQLLIGSGTVPQFAASMIAAAIRQKIQTDVPDSNPAVLFIDAADWNHAPDGRYSTWFAVWLNGSGLPTQEEAQLQIAAGQLRIEAPNTSLLQGENVAVGIRVATIIARAQQQWRGIQKWYDYNGPNPNGNIQLKSFVITASPPDGFTMQITGTDDDPTPDVDFEIPIQETFLIDAEGKVKSIVTGRVVLHTGFWNFFLNPWLFFGSLGVGGLGGLSLLGAGSALASEFGGSPITEPLPGYVGNQIAFNVGDFFWNQFMFQGTPYKATYSRVYMTALFPLGSVTPNSYLTAGGVLEPPMTELPPGGRPDTKGPKPTIK